MLLTLYIGIPGSGKSRLMNYARAKSVSENLEILASKGLDIECTTPFYSWRSIFLKLCALDENCTAEEFSNAMKQSMKEEMYEMIPLFSSVYPDKIKLTNDLVSKNVSLRFIVVAVI